MEPLRLIGYWRKPGPPEYPDPSELVDESSDAQERNAVWWYLLGGTSTRAYMGVSLCRVCEKANGSGELTDGVYAWPEGLAHYVSEHGVRLPQEFVDHALARLRELDERGQDLSWWLANARQVPFPRPPRLQEVDAWEAAFCCGVARKYLRDMTVIRIRRAAPARWTGRKRYDLELRAEDGSLIDAAHGTGSPTAFLVKKAGVHSTDSWDWVRAADEAADKASQEWVDWPYGDWRPSTQASAPVRDDLQGALAFAA